MRPLQFCFAGLALLFLLEGCGQLTGQPDPQALNTSVATAAITVSSTDTPRASITPVPAPSQRPTFTALPTLTRIPTLQGLPSFTAYVSPAVSTLAPIGGATATPEPLRCKLISSSPDWGQVYKPRTDFVAKWQVVNSGTAPWHVDDILFGYVSGEKMQSRDREDTLITQTVYTNDKINLQVRLVPPKEPGSYTAIWGLRRSNRPEFFCTFSVTIRVEK